MVTVAVRPHQWGFDGIRHHEDPSVSPSEMVGLVQSGSCLNRELVVDDPPWYDKDVVEHQVEQDEEGVVWYLVVCGCSDAYAGEVGCCCRSHHPRWPLAPKLESSVW